MRWRLAALALGVLAGLALLLWLIAGFYVLIASGWYF